MDPKDRKFNHNWVDDRLPKWLPHLEKFLSRPYLLYFEIGSFEGRSMCWMFDHVLTDPTSTAICVDPFMPVPTFGFTTEFRTLFFHNTQDFGERITPIVSLSSKAWAACAVVFGDRKADILYIDGSHESADVLQDCCLAWQYSQPGSVFIFDDYDWTLVRHAVDSWLGVMHEQVEILHVGYQIIVRRIPYTETVHSG